MTIVQTGRLTATETGHRNQISANMVSDGSQLGVFQGVQNGLVLTKTSGMGWQLDLGRCSIAPATPANGGVIATVTVAETGTFANGDATRDRIDVVGLQIDETATIANGNPAVKSVIIQGAYPGAGQPVTPTVPAGTIGLWSVRINANTSAGSGGWNTANLVDIRPSKDQHAEFTSTTASQTAGAGINFGTLNADTVKTVNNTFCTADTTGKVTFNEIGIYLVHMKASPTTGYSSIQLWAFDQGATNQIAATGTGYGGQPATASCSVYIDTPGQTLQFGATWNATSTANCRVKISKFRR